VPVEALFTNVPTGSSEWMAAQVAALPRIIIELIILSLIRNISANAVRIFRGISQFIDVALPSGNTMIGSCKELINCVPLYTPNINLRLQYTCTEFFLKTDYYYLISSFRRVLYVVCFLLGNSLASGVYMPTFRSTLSLLSS
jgi:hypothetical protein